MYVLFHSTHNQWWWTSQGITYYNSGYTIPYRHLPLYPILSIHNKLERHQATSGWCSICCCFVQCLSGSTCNPSHRQHCNHGHQEPSDQPTKNTLPAWLYYDQTATVRIVKTLWFGKLTFCRYILSWHSLITSKL